MPRNHGISGQQWAVCDRCGFPYPLNQLIRQKGLTLCTPRRCFDNLVIERRDQIIVDAVADEQEFDNPLSTLESDPGELEF